MNSYENFDTSRFHVFIAILAGLGVFVTFMFYYNVVGLQQQQQDLSALSELTRLNENMNSVLTAIQESSTVIPNFVLTISPLTNSICGATAPTDPITPEACTQRATLSYRIFSVWQDVVISDNFTDVNPVVYVTNFLQRANSNLLFNEWTVSRLNFVDNAQAFGDLLFEYALPITDQTPEVYEKTADMLVADPRFGHIFN
jgi:hypothetical protein